MADSNYWGTQRRVSRRTALRAAGMGSLGLVGAALIGCDGDDVDDNGGGSTPTASGGSGSAATPAEGSGIPALVERAPGFVEADGLGLVPVNTKKVIQGGTFRQPTTTVKYEQDPDLTGNISDHQWMNDRLFMVNGWNGEIHGDLVESWEFKGLDEIILTLRPGVKTWNKAPVNGRILDAEDVALAINRKAGLLAPEDKQRFARASQYSGLERAEAVDDRVVRMVMSAPNGSILRAFTDSRAQVYPREQLEIGWDDPVKAVGTGAWIMTELVEGTRAIFEKNPDYYREWDEGGRPGYDIFEKLVLPDRAAQVSAFITGDVTQLFTIEPHEVAQLSASVPDAQYHGHPSALWDHIALNTRLPLFADERVRNALKLTFDYQALADPTGEGWIHSSILHAMFPETLSSAESAALPGKNADTKEADREEARRLMSAAGYEDGAGASFRLNQNQSSRANFDRAVRMQEQLAELFPQMNVEIVPTADFATYNSQLSSGEWDARSYVHLGVPDVALEAGTYFHSTGSRNYQAYAQPWIDDTMDDLKAAVDEEERTALVQAFERRYWDEGPAIWQTHIVRSVVAYQANTGGQDLVGVTGTWANGNSGYGIGNRWFWQTE